MTAGERHSNRHGRLAAPETDYRSACRNTGSRAQADPEAGRFPRMALAFVSPLVRVAGAPFSTNTEAPATILDSGPLPSSRYEQQLRSDLTKADRSISCLSCTQ